MEEDGKNGKFVKKKYCNPSNLMEGVLLFNRGS